jgi:spore coat protein U-like protein
MARSRRAGRWFSISGRRTVKGQEGIMLASPTGRSPALAASALALALALELHTPVARATTERGRAGATITQAIVVSEAVPMSFAAVAPPPSGGAIVLTTAGTIRSANGGFAFRGTPSPGAFNALGTPHHPTSVSFSANNLVTGPGPAMRLGAFTNNAAAAFDGTANLKFMVGATLVINPNQTPGQYTGTYAVTVNF